MTKNLNNWYSKGVNTKACKPNRKNNSNMYNMKLKKDLLNTQQGAILFMSTIIDSRLTACSTSQLLVRNYLN